MAKLGYFLWKVILPNAMPRNEMLMKVIWLIAMHFSIIELNDNEILWNATLLNVILLNVTLLNVIAVEFHHVKCHSVSYHSVECH